MRNFSTPAGSLPLPMLAAILILVVSGTGTWGLLRNWRALVETQLRLDRCIGRVSLEFRDRMNRITKINSEITGLRLSVAAAALEPTLIPPLKAALQFEVLRQEAELAVWKLRQLQWVSRQSCLRKGEWFLPLPGMHWTRPAEDPLGPQPLEWNGSLPKQFQIEAGHDSRTAAALVFRPEADPMEGLYGKTKFSARWAIPTKLLARSNFH